MFSAVKRDRGASDDLDNVLSVLSFLRAAFGRAPWPAFDRPLLLDLHTHGLAAFAFAAAARTGHALPPQTKDELRNSVMANLAANEKRAPHLADVLCALALTPSIAPLAFKGLDYAHRLYADPSERPMGDHDLLVPDLRFGEALARLHAIGFRSALEQTGVAALAGHYAAQLVRDGYQLDLHRAVRQPSRAAIDYSAIFARSTAGDVRGAPVRWLDARDRLLLHVYHQAAHEFSVPLVTFVDLELMLPADRALVQRAKDFGIARPLAHALHLRDQIFGYATRAPPPFAAVLPAIAEIARQERPPRALQLVRKAVLFDSPRALGRFARYSAGALSPFRD